MQCKLSELLPGETGRIVALVLDGAMRRRVQDLGFLPEVEVKALFCGVYGGIRAYAIHESVIALRRGDAAHIIVDK